MGPPNGCEKGALSQTPWVCRAVSPGRCPRRRRPLVRRCAPDREALPALPNPPRPPCAGGSRPSAPGPVHVAPLALSTCPDLRPPMGAPVLASHSARRGDPATLARAAGPCRCAAVAPVGSVLRLAPSLSRAATREPGLAGGCLAATGREERSPLGSPLPWRMAGDAGGAWALRQRQGGRVLARGAGPRLRAAPPPLTPPPRRSAWASQGSATWGAARRRSGDGPWNRPDACEASLSGWARLGGPTRWGGSPPGLATWRGGCAPALRSASCQSATQG